MKQDRVPQYLPLSATDFQLLLALSEGALHGYAISKSVREASGGRVRIGLGSLYRVIARLVRTGIVEECKPDRERGEDANARRRYRLTELGMDVLRAEVSRLSDALKLARSNELLRDGNV